MFRDRRRRRPSLKEYVGTGLLMASTLCVVAILGVGFAALINVFGGDIASEPPGDLAIALLFIFLGYFTAAIIAAVVLWVIYPIKESFWGFVIRGAVLAPIIYGAVGIASVLLYVYAGINIMDYESPKAAWSYFRFLMPTFSVLGAVIWGPILYYQHRREHSS